MLILVTRKFHSRRLSRFVKSDSAGVFLVIAFELLAFLWANSPLSPAYFSIRDVQIGVAGM